MTRPEFSQYGRPKRVEGGLRATSTRGDIGESWWSKRFLSVLESFPGLGGRLGRGRSYARAGQVLELSIAPGVVTSRVQGSAPSPYRVSIQLDAFDSPTWTKIETGMAGQAVFLARLLAGEMPQQIEEVFTAAQAPLFPARQQDLRMSCSCPDATVPCKHIAATFYLLAEAFDADPFQILHWRGRDRQSLLANLRSLRGTPHGDKARKGRRRTAQRSRTVSSSGGIGAVAALAEVASPSLDEVVGRFWVAPVPLGNQPPTLLTDVDLVLRALPTPDKSLGGTALTEALRPLYATFRPPTGPS
jgi:uncharacterized Zn finger protein